MNKDRVFFFITALFTAILLTMLISIAKAEQRTTYDAQTGKAITRETIDSQGTRTTYDAQTGRAITRESKPKDKHK